MNYLILYKNEAWRTNWYDYENNYIESMVVFDLLKDIYTTNGISWFEIEQDNL